jgi:HAD superfamily hydrolase (TIGR01509 family)
LNFCELAVIRWPDRLRSATIAGVMIAALVLDFDGLILDTEVPVFRSWEKVYLDHGATLDLAMWRTIIGTDGYDPAAELDARLGRALDWATINEARRQHRDELQELERIRPGVVEWLNAAAALGLSTAVASSSPRVWVEGHLVQHGMRETFSCIRCRDDVGVAKPDPAVYTAVLEALGVEGEEAIAVEDSVHGVTAAKAAGLWCVAVPGQLTRGMDFSAADLVLDSLAERPLDEVIASLPSARRRTG